MNGLAETDFYGAFLHELNQPLTTLRNILELTTYRESNDWASVVESSMNNVDRMVELLDLMGELSRLGRIPPPLVPVDIAELLREAVEDLGASALANGCNLKAEGLASAAWVRAAPDPLRAALFRVLGDALHHIHEGQTVSLALQRQPRQEPETELVLLEIRSPGAAFAQNECASLQALARTGRGPRGGITRRVFRVALSLRILVLQGALLELQDQKSPDSLMRLVFPSASR